MNKLQKKYKMFSVNLDHAEYGSLIKNFADKAEVHMKKNLFNVPSTVGDGYFKYIDLPNGLQCLVADLKLKQDIYLKRRPLAEEFYILRFDEFIAPNDLMVKIADEYIWECSQRRNSVLLTSSLLDFECMASAGTAAKSIIVLLTKEWLTSYVNTDDVAGILKTYLRLKTSDFNFASFDIKYKTLFKQVTDYTANGKMNIRDIEDRIMMMVDKFLNELSDKLGAIKEYDKIKISPDEVRRLMEAESCLVKKFCAPAPSIYSLSKVAAMSTTSLKTKFKKMYGYTLHEYFQKSRMQRAKVLLLTGKYSIKEIGSQLGYCNLSNFTIAFKKEFNRLPRHFLVNLYGHYNNNKS